MNQLKVYKDGVATLIPFTVSIHDIHKTIDKRLPFKREAIILAHKAGFTTKAGKPLITNGRFK